MDIVKNQIDDLNIELTLNIAAQDYAPLKKKKINERRRTADFKGFRRGMVPASLVERVYGEQCLGEAVNDIISEQLGKYIEESGQNFIGEPIASENQPDFEWKDGNDFVFKFDLGIAPAVDFTVSAEDKIVNYNIKISDIAKEEMKKNMLMQYGELEEVDTPSAESYVYVDLKNDDKTIENGYISMRDVTEAMKPALMGVKAGDKLSINVNELFEREGDRATLLKVKKEDLGTVNPEFEATVVNIKTFVEAKADQQTFDKIFGEGKVNSQEDFDKEIENRLKANYKQETDFRLSKDIKDYFVKKADIKLPESFLKRWLYSINKDKFSMEDIEKEFDAFLLDYKWQLVCEFLTKKYEIKIEKSDLEKEARNYVLYQYAMYGMPNLPEDFLESSVNKMLDDRQQAQRIFEQVNDMKVIDAVKKDISFSKKSITVEAFRELK